MNKVTGLSRKVKGQSKVSVLSKASSVVGIDIGKENLSCALMDIKETMKCRFGPRFLSLCPKSGIELHYMV